MSDLTDLDLAHLRASIDIAAQAQREGIKDLRQSGLLKVKQGVTSLDEVLSTTNA